MASVTIIGDSFIKRLRNHRPSTRLLENDPTLSVIRYMFQFTDGRSVQSIYRILQADPSIFPTSALLVFHIGGNDFMNVDIPPRQLARLFVERIIDILIASRSIRACVFPILHRYGLSAYTYHTSRYRDIVSLSNIHDMEKDFNHNVDDFNDEIRKLTRPDPRLRYGKLPGIITDTASFLDPDGVHLHHSEMLRYAAALKLEVRIGTSAYRRRLGLVPRRRVGPRPVQPPVPRRRRRRRRN